MATKWTKEQREVIDSRGSNLLVAAAAGSGKTAVMIERIIQLVIDKEKPIDIDKLLVVTFTRAAAAEMKERVGIAIEKALDSDPENEHLQRQAILLSKADITTIDSFCGKIVRENFHVIDLEPDIKVADETEIGIISAEVLEDLLDDLYNSHDEDLLKIFEWYGNKNGDESLGNLMIKINRFVSAFPYPEKWLEDSAEFFNNVGKDEKFYIDSYLIPTAKDVFLIIKSRIRKIKEIVDITDENKDLEKMHLNAVNLFSGVKSVYNALKSFLELENIESWNNVGKSVYEYKNYVSNFINFRASKKWSEESSSIYSEYKDVFKNIKNEMENSINDLSIELNVLIDEHNRVYPYMRSLSNLVLKYREAFSYRKRSLGIMDFADIESFALKILSEKDENGKIVPSMVANSYKDLYEEVFTDEYQDSNMIQEVILSLVSSCDYPNRFMVGDVKQSIYRFRQAMPEIFMNKYDTYKTGDNAGEDKKILLYNNFRSRAEVLEGCNHIFKSIMKKETGELDYTDDERLNPSAFFEELSSEVSGHCGGPIEIYLSEKKKNNSEADEEKDIENSVPENQDKANISKIVKDYSDNEAVEEDSDNEDLTNFEIEAKNIANIIYKMVNENNDSNFMVFDKATNEYRRVEYRDIVILMSALKTKASILEEKMYELGIPTYSDQSSGYFSTLEVSTIENLLRIIDNPMQDIPLLSVLRSEIFEFDANELSRIRLHNRNGDFYQALKEVNDNLEEFDADEGLKNKIAHFFSSLERYIEKSVLLPVDELIMYLYEDTNYYNYVGVLEMGEQRQNNLKLLYERARQFEGSSFRGIFNFINYIERLKNKSVDLGEAKNVSDDANLVRIMSIHKSKGLEFPVVILANADRRFKLNQDDSNLFLHSKYGYGPTVFDIENNVSYNSYIKNRIKSTHRNEMLAESMRLLYVAMTRAKEKLIITGGIKAFVNNELPKWESFQTDEDGNLDSYEILSKNSFLDWIMPAIVNLAQRDKFINVYGEEMKYLGYGDCKWSIGVSNNVDIVAENKNLIENHRKLVENVIERLNESNSDIKAGDVDNDDLKKNDTHKYSIEGIESIKYYIEGSEIDKADIEVAKDIKIDNNIVEILKNNFNTSYRYESSSSKPSSISVSEIKKIFDDDEEYHEKYFKQSRNIDFKVPNFMHTAQVGVEFSSSEKGTIFHLVMQLLDFARFKDILTDNARLRWEIENQIKALVGKKILSTEEANTINATRIVKFIRSDIFTQILDAQSRGRLYREKAINYSIRVNELYPQENINDNERLMLVGIIDLFFENRNGKLILIDYKTDYVDENNLSEVVSRYKIQLEYYKKAIEDISGKEVESKYIYLFGIGELVKI
ncbi:UvrD-helicase domain-containing protein [Peptostreptococcus sp. D1]|uniref:UvrD-helicase domain-containing protein n=1 Tax=Peptostreptococcus sp. D1 TaxID=72304 RepID=UPI0008F35B43|nr:UvrD-helicase domain-containing protein [Peptostreptococcus sp. D1]SFE51187.1 DNA helicase/exodeoxyribonuclease V, subunit A [Peptostreptococcus sp. D1]